MPDVIVGSTRGRGRREADRGVGDRRAYSIARMLIDLFLVVKLYRIAEALKFLQGVKLLEPLTMVASGVLAGGVYSLTMKISLVAGLLISYIVHELGHFWGTMYRGLRASWWIFLPFAGQWMEAPDFRSRDDEAFIAFAGPFVGGVFSFILYSLWLTVPLSPEWGNILFSIAFLSTLLNLFNMIPLSPLDGGRITVGVSGWFRVAGYIALLALSLFGAQASVIVVWMVVLSEVRMPPLRRFVVASAMFVAMLILLWAGFHSASRIEDSSFACVGVLLLVLYFARWKNPSPPPVRDFRNVSLSRVEKRKWLTLYVLLFSALTVLFVWGFLPHINKLTL